MNTKLNLDKFSFDVSGKHFQGKHVATGLAVGASLIGLYAFRKIIVVGKSCTINKDLTGKNVVITGGNGGIGRQTAKRLVQLGANVIIGARDEDKNKSTVEELSKIAKGNIVSYKLDLADTKSIQTFVQIVKKTLNGQAIDILINNAGIMALLQHKHTKQNLQMQIGVNHYGHFYLTYLLWDSIKLSKNPRIVNVSSSAHMSLNKNYDIDFDNIHFQNGGYDSFTAYSKSKKANILFTKQLQRRMTEQNINGTVVCLHPGAVRTDLQANYLSSWWRKGLAALFYPLILFTFKNANQGSQTNLYCSLQEDNKLVKGGYYSNCKLTKTLAPQVEDIQAARKLWADSQKTFGITFNV